MTDVKRSIATWFVAFNCKIELLCYLWSFRSDTVRVHGGEGDAGVGAVVAVCALGLLCPGLSPGGPGRLFAAACMGSVVSGNLFAGQRHASPGAVLQAVLSANGIYARFPALLYKVGWAAVEPTRDADMQGQSCSLPALRSLCFPLPPLTVALTFFFLNVDHF